MSTGDKENGAAFTGNPEHLERFRRLVATRARSKERGDALQAWSEYKKELGRAYVIAQRPRSRRDRPWTKGDYVRSLTVPAVDLRGAAIPGVCLGYVDLRGARLDDITLLPGEEPYAVSSVALKGAKLESASLRNARLPGVRLMDADLRFADLSGADLTEADLRGADLRGARVFGLATWDVKLCNRERLRRGAKAKRLRTRKAADYLAGHSGSRQAIGAR